MNESKMQKVGQGMGDVTPPDLAASKRTPKAGKRSKTKFISVRVSEREALLWRRAASTKQHLRDRSPSLGEWLREVCNEAAANPRHIREDRHSMLSAESALNAA